jgi:hypothetical protein
MRRLTLQLHSSLILPALVLMGTVPGQALAETPTSAKPAAQDASSKNLIRSYREALERRLREVLQTRIDGYLSKRVDQSAFMADFDLTFDEKRISAEISALQGGDVDILISSAANRKYEDLRKYFKEVAVILNFSKDITATESGPIVKALQSYLAVGENPIETVRAGNAALPPSPQERALRMQIEEKRREQEMRGQTEVRLRQLDHELKLKQLEREAELRKSKGGGDDGELKSLLDQERKKREELAEIVNQESLKDKIAREMPLILRLSSVAAVLGAFFLVAFALFGLIMSSGMKSLANSFRQGLEGLAGSIGSMGGGRGGGGEKTTFEMKIDTGDAFRGGNGGGGGGSGSGSGSQLDLGKMSALDNIVNEIRDLARADVEMAAALVSRLADRGEFEQAFSMLDLFGTELAHQTIGLLPEQTQRNMKRRYLASEVKQPAVDALFQQAVTARALMTAGDQLLTDGNERLLARILLSHSDEELASGLSSLPVEAAVAVLTRLPPNKVMVLLRAAPKEQARAWRQALSSGMRVEIPLSTKELENLRGALRDPDKGRFEEARGYFQEILATADEKEFQDFLEGLESTPDLCLAVTGNRATMEDLWEQPLPIITRLFNDLTLEDVAVLLYEAPESVRQSYLTGCVERRRMMINDGLHGLASNEQHRNKAIQSVAEIRKQILKDLSSWAESGETELPSRKRLLDKLESSRNLKRVA